MCIKNIYIYIAKRKKSMHIILLAVESSYQRVKYLRSCSEEELDCFLEDKNISIHKVMLWGNILS